MKVLSVAEVAKKWNISERSVRNYCANGRIEGAFLTGKTWNVPENAVKPSRLNGSRRDLLSALLAEKRLGVSGGIYHKVQVELTYNSNHIEGSRLSHEQTRFIYETNTIGVAEGSVLIDDVIEAVNHFRCVDMVIMNARKPLSQRFIKYLHRVLKSGTSDGDKGWFAVGEYKRLPNEVAGMATVAPEDVEQEMSALLESYAAIDQKSLDDLLEFHHRFERIHPFQDGNGRVGRLILFKECLRNGIVPFVIDEQLKFAYYRGLAQWKNERGFLRETCLSAQDKFKAWLNYYKIKF